MKLHKWAQDMVDSLFEMEIIKLKKTPFLAGYLGVSKFLQNEKNHEI